MDTIEKLFEETNQIAFYKFVNHKVFINKTYGWKLGGKHDWRNYVPKEIKICWEKLTDREKKLIFIVCESIADNV